MNTTRKCHYRQVQGLEVHEADDGLIIFNAGTDRVHHLNQTAGVLFELCLQAQTLAGLLESMQQLYELEQMPLDEIRQTVSKLVAEGVLEEVDEA
jgi:hypothetical protein